ncbi:hypothetical protein [Kitasatospora sp. SUK 42]|uniref:hypothetical protein n=1 Tax=Kitasatospora sp. SUK 42 TaxID=1588882 RepID=UPI0018CA9FA5|nr:hypothetical protein [Kitasatospora sp. SUK 42]MBV2154874.1 hypothetical protein [Kitasatospora sp. SUK 42]
METLLYAAELVEEGGAYRLVVQDVARNTVRTIPVPKAMVDKFPTFLSALGAKLNPASPSKRR